METYRYRGHSMSDPANYRSKEEVDKVRDEQDPITNLRARLIAANIFTEDDAKAMDREVRAIVTEAAEFAQTSPVPDPSELYTDVLVEA
jgi:pyruvate dehydrogenase E1 component alpha subunit